MKNRVTETDVPALVSSDGRPPKSTDPTHFTLLG